MSNMYDSIKQVAKPQLSDENKGKNTGNNQPQATSTNPTPKSDKTLGATVIAEAIRAAPNAAELNLQHVQELRHKRWSFIQSDLTEALNTWKDLETKAATISPEEEQFEKIKTIIGQLRHKLDQF